MKKTNKRGHLTGIYFLTYIMVGVFIILFAVAIISLFISDNKLETFCKENNMTFKTQSTGFLSSKPTCIEIVNNRAISHGIIKTEDGLFLKED